MLMSGDFLTRIAALALIGLIVAVIKMAWITISHMSEKRTSKNSASMGPEEARLPLGTECPRCHYRLLEPDWRCPECYHEFGSEDVGGEEQERDNPEPAAPVQVSQSISISEEGKAAGTVTHYSNGKNSMEFGPNADFTTVLSSSFVMFAQFLSPPDRETFANWAGWSSESWTERQREAFALTLMHYLHELKAGGRTVPKAAEGAIQELPHDNLPPLDRPLADDVRHIFDKMLGG